jgi:hypothetical protein
MRAFYVFDAEDQALNLGAFSNGAREVPERSARSDEAYLCP